MLEKPNLEQFLFTQLPHGEQDLIVNYVDNDGISQNQSVKVTKANRDAFIVTPTVDIPHKALLTALIKEVVVKELASYVTKSELPDELEHLDTQIVGIIRNSDTFVEIGSFTDLLVDENQTILDMLDVESSVRDVLNNSTLEIST